MMDPVRLWADRLQTLWHEMEQVSELRESSARLAVLKKLQNYLLELPSSPPQMSELRTFAEELRREFISNQLQASVKRTKERSKKWAALRARWEQETERNQEEKDSDDPLRTALLAFEQAVQTAWELRESRGSSEEEWAVQLKQLEEQLLVILVKLRAGSRKDPARIFSKGEILPEKNSE